MTDSLGARHNSLRLVLIFLSLKSQERDVPMITGSTKPVVRTIGHSNRSLEDFLDVLDGAGVELLVDVRSHPNSRRFPHFSEGNLETSLSESGIEYKHCPELGGYRDPRKESPNTALSEGFRAVADHLNSEAGQEALRKLETTILNRDGDSGVILMCAEKDYTRCHRRLVADHLTVRGLSVEHIIGKESSEHHSLHPNARPEGRTVKYPGLV